MKIKVLLYTTKAKPTLYNVLGKFITTKYMGKDFKQDGLTHPELNGKIVAECDYEVEEIEKIYCCGDIVQTKTMTYGELLGRSCLTDDELVEYNPTKAIHIKNLHVFDEPKELKECHKKYGGKNYSPICYMPITSAPQNMMKVWLYENGKWVMYILISIQAQWMCKILNKEKDIEVRKVILKEMLRHE